MSPRSSVGSNVRYRRGTFLAVLASNDVNGDMFWLCQARQHVLEDNMPNGFRAAWMESIGNGDR